MKKEHFNIDIVYPHDYDREDAEKIYNIEKNYTFYDYLVLFLIGGLALIITYNLIDEMQEKGYMLLIVFIIGFCALLG